MARVQLSSIIADIRGSIGGSTFQRNASGLILRNKSGTLKAVKTRQSFNRTMPNLMNKAWHSIPLANQLQWNLYAQTYTLTDAFGRTKTLTGFNYFFSINTWLIRNDYPLFISPPPRIDPTPPPAFTIRATRTTLELILAEDFTASDHVLLVFLSLPTSLNTNFSRSQYRKVVQVNAPTLKVIDLTEAFALYFNFEYTDIANTQCIRFNAYIQSLLLTSGLRSSGIFSSSQVCPPGSGIGCMIIEDTFVIRPGIGGMFVGTSFIVA